MSAPNTPAPDRVVLVAPALFDPLHALLAWVNATPASVDLSDRTWERISELVQESAEECLPDDDPAKGGVVDAEIVADGEAARLERWPDLCVVWLDNNATTDEGFDEEHHVLLRRGPA